MTYVYRLHVHYPPEPTHIPDTYWVDEEDRGFEWPRERLFLSYSAAKRRKDLLESMGCEVQLERSLPVEWDHIGFREDVRNELLAVLRAGGPGRT